MWNVARPCCFLLSVCACTLRPVPYQDGSASEGASTGADDCGMCPDGAVCFEGTCVGIGLVRVSLAWDVVTDLDLHVVNPAGTEVFFENPQAAGLTLDVDDCVGGFCVDNEGVHVENVFFSSGALRGQYRVFVVNFDGLRASDYRLEVVTLEGAQLAEWTGSLPAVPDAKSPEYTFNW